MTPYPCIPPRRRAHLLLNALFFLALAVSPALAGDAANPSAADSFIHSGLEHYNNLEYDAAFKDFQKAAELKPDDPQSYNHLLEAVLFRELYKRDALDTSLYTQEGFLRGTPIQLDPPVREQIKEFTDKALALAEKRLKSNSKDVQALYARGVTRGLHSTYLGLVEKAWFSALRSALGSRSDHEAVLAMQPDFIDAKTIVGIHNYIVGALPLRTKILASIIGVSGDKKKGLEYLAEVGKTTRESSVDARVALALFLRREQRYDDALNTVESLRRQYPRNFLFALEQANLLKDGGKGPAAVAAYRKLVEESNNGKYSGAHVELAQFGLGEALRGQHQYAEAIQAYEAAGAGASDNHDLRQRALLDAGEVSDLLTKRQDAVRDYQAAIALDSSSNEAGVARKYLDTPYKGR